jgi:hypothetical protein
MQSAAEAECGGLLLKYPRDLDDEDLRSGPQACDSNILLFCLLNHKMSYHKTCYAQCSPSPQDDYFIQL